MWLGLVGVALGADLVVDPSGAGDYTTVGAAVGAAASGDRVVMVAGDYSGESTVPVDLDLEFFGSAGPNVTEAPRLWVSGPGVDVVVRDLALTCDATVEPALLVEGGASAELDGVRTSVCADGLDRTFVEASEATIWVHGSTFNAAGTQVSGLGVDLTIEDSTFGVLGVSEGLGVTLAGIPGFLPATLVIRRSTFTDYTKIGGYGAAVGVLSVDTVSLEDVAFANNTGDRGGAFYARSSGPVEVVRASFTGNTANEGGAVYLESTEARFEHASFAGDVGVAGAGAVHFVGDAAEPLTLEYVAIVDAESNAVGGALLFAAPAALGVRGSWICGSVGSVDGSVVTIRDAASSEFQGTAVAFNAGADAVRISGGGDHAFANVTFAGIQEDAVRVDGTRMTIDVRETIFHDGDSFAVTGIDTSGGAFPPAGSGSRNNLFDVTGGWASGIFDATTFAAGSTLVDPMFQGYTASCDTVNLWLDRASPLRDLGADFDLDGTPSDLGAFGGPWANLADADGDLAFEDVDCDEADDAVSPFAVEIPYDGVDQDCSGADLTDVDGDGSDGGPDCDDQDEAIHPGATDTWYDGIDSDCDGADDFDQDGDGFPSDDHDGTDCDDTDAAISPAGTEVKGDGVDQDCDGVDAISPHPEVPTGDEPSGGCGCDQGAAGAPLAGLALVGALLVARRREVGPDADRARQITVAPRRTRRAAGCSGR